MNTNESSRAVSPVVGVILVVAITVALSGVVGVFVFDLGQSVSDSNSQSGIATRTTYNDDGTASIQVVTGEADEVRVLVNGTEEENITSPSPGVTLTVPATSESSVTIISEQDGKSTIVSSSGTASSGPTGPTKGLIAHYKLDGDATDSVGTNDGTTSDIAFTTGKLNQAAGFGGDGSDSYINLPSSFSGSESFTITAWYNADAGSLDDSSAIMVAWGGGYDTYNHLQWTGSTWSWGLEGSSGDKISGGSSVTTTGEWQLITAVLNSGTLKLYINDTQVASGSGPSSVPDNGNWDIGTFDSGGWMWTGKIDDVRVYDRALNDSEVNDLYSETK